MRAAFAKALHNHMLYNDKIWLIVGDLGYGFFDKHFTDFPKRTLNPGPAEQVMMDVAIGLALEGKIPFVYSIASFLLYRPFESLRTYINHEKIPVKLVASGRDKDYESDGISHWSEDATDILNTLPNIHQFWPEEKDSVPFLVADMVHCSLPDFISLKR